jgi:NAD(P)-dependent dehydrogenase (short-subunit alcohol dehydrogenase family)
MTTNNQSGTDRVAVVTGGSAGLGRAISRELAHSGWDVAVLARGTDGLSATAAEVRDAGRRALAVEVDLADAQAVEAAADRVEAELGAIGVWVNNAMASVFAEFLDVDPEEFERATAVTYLGTVNGTRAALRRMVPRDSGHIVQVGSALAYRGIPLQAAYCGAKHAVVGLTESVLAELAHRGSHVQVSMVHMPALNTVQFSWVRSKLPQHPQPVPPIYQPEVGARAVRQVVDHPRRNTWVGAPTAATILGNRVAPGLLDRYLGRTGYDSQQTAEDIGEMLPDNLFAPVPGDHGAHGAFDHRAHDTSVQSWMSQHRVPVAAAAGVAMAGVGLALMAVRQGRR